MKKSEFLFSLILVPLDYVMIFLAGASAYSLRFAKFATAIRPVIFNLSFANFSQIVLVVGILWLAAFALAGMYSISGPRQLAQEINRVVLGCSLGLVLIVVYIFFQRNLFDSRFIVLMAWILAIVYVSLGRIFIRWLQVFLYRYGMGVHKVILVGYSQTADSLIHEFFSQKTSGYEVVKRVGDFSLDTVHELEDFVKNYNAVNVKNGSDHYVDEIIQADPNLSKAEVLRIYDFANDHHLTFKYVADLLGIKVLRNEVVEIAGVPVVEIKKTTLEGWGAILKRLVDVLLSGIFIAILSPLILLTMLAIKLDSRGPIFFSRRDDGSYVFRVGKGGQPFKYFKFRSMIAGSDSLRHKELLDRNLRTDGPLTKFKDDPRVTRVGKFIRRWSVDELPELFLVFMGRMSLVGPRPHLPEEVAKYEQHHRKVLTIKPGITGLAQVSGRSDLSFEEEVKLDIYYIENWSLLLDLSILLRTPLAVFKHRETE